MIPWNKGKIGLIKHTKEWKLNMAKLVKEQWRTGKRKKGYKLSQETKEKIRKYQKGRPKPWFLGRKLSKEHIRKISLANGGTGIPVRPSKRYYHRQDRRYKNWRSKVFERDNWICQTCGERGCYLHPHHIKGWTKYPKLRYVVTNGVTLCVECHRLTHKKY
jgi:hypothetical protein